MTEKEKEFEKTKVNFWIPTEVYKRLEKIAKQADIDKTRLMVNILDEVSKSMEASGKVGLLQFSVLMRNLGEKMNDWAKGIKAIKFDL